MFKVLIVDDEIYIISLIQHLVDWERYGMEVVGTADNGITALQEVERLQPDIVIVDVRMPGYDGITFMQKVREIDMRIKFIVISGHKKFEYAKSAMKYNVEDYLIKPISKEELESILGRLKQKLEEEQRSEEQRKAMSMEIGEHHRQIQTRFAEVFFKNQIPEAQLNEADINSSYFTTFTPGGYYGLILKPDSSHKLDAGFVNTLLGKISEQFSKTLEPCSSEIVLRQQRDSIQAVVNIGEVQDSVFMEELQKFFNAVTDMLKKFEEILFTIAIGTRTGSLAESVGSLAEASMCIQGRMTIGTQRFLHFSEIKEDSGAIHAVLTHSVKEKWKEAIRSLQAGKMKAQILNIFSSAEKFKYQDSLIFMKTASMLYKSFYDYIVQIDLYRDSYEEFWNEFMESACWAYTPRMLADALADQMGRYVREYASEDGQESNPAIRIAKKYILENYTKNITMASMAEIVSLSPVYFSILFKREVGTNFLDYLTQYRLEISKNLLKQVKYNINEVASLSGFQDAKYFSKVFKKTFGITPSEYRRRNAG